MHIDKKAQESKTISIIMVAIILIIVAWLLIHYNVVAFAKSKIVCSSLGVADGFCIEKKEDCVGVINPLAKCDEKLPFCCLGELKSKAGETPATGGQAPLTPVNTTEPETPQTKGVMEFYCKCKIDKDLMVITNTFSKLEIKDLKKDNVDF